MDTITLIVVTQQMANTLWLVAPPQHQELTLHLQLPVVQVKCAHLAQLLS